MWCGLVVWGGGWGLAGAFFKMIHTGVAGKIWNQRQVGCAHSILHHALLLTRLPTCPTPIACRSGKWRRACGQRAD